ncbi:hypothetical protein QFZ80_001473 [Paenibacillus sp. V4I7]|nr:hypothetical protein [Paenibacillus sp. V4I7]MDQ0916349.1 hypothetical protein [Paenibacillus sp. V4I5]
MSKYTHLAWHETLDMHELVAFQTNGCSHSIARKCI